VPCFRCGKVQTDPAKGASPWVRGVVGTEQVLLCPECKEIPEALEELRKCPRCGATRLSVILGSLVCRACGYEAEI
jgi:Zn finger protein HypA/HybF involved in hydrogenase expression